MSEKAPGPGFHEPPPPYPSAPDQPLPGYGNPPSIVIPGHYQNTSYAIPNSAPGQPTVVVHVAQFGPHPVQTTCPTCQSNIMTETLTTPGLLTWIASGTLLLLGCWLGCCLIPCCMRSCQDIEHKCPNCRAHLGAYKRL